MILLWPLLLSSLVNGHGPCSGEGKDVGSHLVKQLYDEIHQGECDLAHQTHYDSYVPGKGEAFDFIVVGGGSSGSVVASRLAENPHWNILLVEAGGDPTMTSEIPGLFGASQDTEIDWQFKTHPQDGMFQGLADKRSAISRGKVLGGSNTLQYYDYVRGSPKDYDHWKEEGNEGWGYHDVLPYFKRSEGIRAKEIVSDPKVAKYHGKDGPLTVESIRDDGLSTLEAALSKAMDELGYHTHTDVNADAHDGLFVIQGTLRHKRRCSAAKAFLSEKKPNLKIAKHTLVTQILIQNRNKSAYGVELLRHDGEHIRVRANREVILAAGAINTPKLLLLSGIGEQEALQKHVIEPICLLEVGKNLQNHIQYPGIFYSFPHAHDEDPHMTKNLVEYLTHFTGPLSHSGPVRTIGFINADKDDWPDIALLPAFFGRNSSAIHGFLNSRRIIPEIQEYYLKVNSHSPVLIITAALLRPKGRGKVELHSAHPKDDVEILPNILNHEEDVEKLLNGIAFAAKLSETKGMTDLGAKLHYADIPACHDHKPPTPEYLVCALKHIALTSHHPSGTCKMGPESDDHAVVSPRLKVYGLKHLRVADMSIAPNGISGNTNIAAIMIGEKAADMIKEDWEHHDDINHHRTVNDHHLPPFPH
ncbi:glucose dehydrogenase [FAD, quinone]-like [Macrosteles quadrilineatus]|uniref:glucose dehydrogenase [FAD, quinone]-like n=1 Tax=Macrosteles quadrilineatus TaxID=74068 RepID=UPI0023E176EA|nr:glucose dehydrogenase [FAD, quinone]-like [Macrosteles quadrilineatus]